MPIRPTAVLLSLATMALLILAGSAVAQGFDADRYLAQCERFYEGEDYISARESCGNALQLAPDRQDVQLATARTEVQLGRFGEALPRLRALDGRFGGPEPALLLAEIAVEQGRFGDASTHVANARRLAGADAPVAVQVRLAFLAGTVAEGRGEVRTALARYGEAIAADPTATEPRLASARLRFVSGDLSGARSSLEQYLSLRPDDRDPRVRSQLGRIAWAQGDLDFAAGQLETALSLWETRRTSEQAEDLRTLGLVYLGQGDLGRGELALREASRRGNQVALLGGNLLLWMLLALVLVVVHLLAESRIENRSGLELVEGPQPWTIGQVYGIAIAAGATGLLAGVLAGLVVYGNLLAMLTPFQSADVRAVAAAVFALVAAFLVTRRIRLQGWRASDRLFGASDTWAAGVMVGLGLLAATLGYLAWRPEEAGWFGGPWMDLSRVTLLVALSMVALPFTEFLFRSFAFDAFEYRYGTGVALFLSGALSTLVLATPVVLLLPFGMLLAELYRRSRSGTLVLAAQATLHLGLLLAATLLPWARGLFL